MDCNKLPGVYQQKFLEYLKNIANGNILQNILFKLDIAVNVIWVYDRT